jgi:hypothetical protein
MPMTMMRVGEVCVAMRQCFMRVWMRVLCAWGNRFSMGMLVVGVVRVFMLMFHRLMRVFVAMPLAQMQPDTGQHERPRNQ